MGVIREGTIHRWVPGFKVSGKKNALTPCSPTEDLTELGQLATSLQYGCVMMDTFTVAGERVLRDLASRNLASGGKETKRVTLEVGDAKYMNPTKQDYGMFATVIESWLKDIVPFLSAGGLLVLSGHQRLYVERDDDDEFVSAFGGLGMPGRTIMENMPKYVALLARMTTRKRKGAKGVERVIQVVPSDQYYNAKDRYGVYDEATTTVEVPRADYETREEWQEAVLDAYADWWGPWVEEWASRDEGAIVAVYGEPGLGKTLALASLALVLREVMDLPSLLCDWDGNGSASIPRKYVDSSSSTSATKIKKHVTRDA